MTRVAKLFRNGRSQAVRLPAEFRFRTKSVSIRRDSSTGEVILSARPDSWEGFFKLPPAPPDFLNPRVDPVPERGDPFAASARPKASGKRRKSPARKS
jgi:antitoxin VapB